MKLIKYKILTLLFCIAYSSILHSQINDFGLWTSIAVEKKINKHFSININNDFRFNENLTELGRINNDLGVEYKINKIFSFSLNYRLGNMRLLDDSYIARHRIFVDFKAKRKISKFDLSLRLRLQQQYLHNELMAENIMPKTYLRPKLQIKYRDLIYLKPYLAYQIFIPLNIPERRIVDEHRIVLGLDYKINKQHSFGIYAMYDKEFAKKKTYINNIIGIEYNFSF
ncbi:MAG: DUF2490 domain-containing protein [Bacteroidales bacterium]|jgi:hypothetical protein|nr:DUF2490 domain-containing protein [Bacteroidales bacterium]MCK9499182.1 DUF2490 domain-containing protein [Bacteroidales bacterium]MDY0314441.1 DUF2490 domain-containing protein [Bacteroidales bacterium]